MVSFHTLPVGFPLPTISKNSLHTLFCSLIFDHGVLLIISTYGAKILVSNFLLDTSFHHSFQSVIIRFYLLLMSLQVIQFQYGLEFFINLYNPSKISSGGIFVMDNKIPSHSESNS